MEAKEALQNLITNATPAEIEVMAKILQEQLSHIKWKEQEENWNKVKCAVLDYIQKYGDICVNNGCEYISVDSHSDFDTFGEIALRY